MKLVATAIPEVFVLEPHVLSDDRGWFFEAWNQQTWRTVTGLDVEFVQDNHSRSRRNVLRGVHYQVTAPQGKLVRATLGAIWDIAIDLRRSSSTFLQHVAVELSDDTHRMLWVPPGFGHGFMALTDMADVVYKTSEFYVAEYDRSVRYDDPALAIPWPLDGVDPITSDKDMAAPSLADAELFD